MEFPTISEMAIDILLFYTLYLCEAALAVVKSKYQSKVENIVCPSVPNTQLRPNSSYKSKQAHLSH